MPITHSKLERSLAGLQAGMLGGAALLAVVAFLSMLDRRTGWSYPNLLGAEFYGPRFLGAGLGWPAVSGIAFQLLIAACAGALFGRLFGGVTGTGRFVLMAMFWGLLLFYASEEVYRTTSTYIAAYYPRNAALMAHLSYGLCLASLRRIGDSEHRLAAHSDLEPGVRERSSQHASMTQALHDDADSTGQESTL